VIETELKILLDAAGEAALRRQPLLRKPGAMGRPQTLTSIYFDTAGRDLARAGMALRVRRVGRRWIQTIKRRDAVAMSGLSMPEEEERPVPQPVPVLDDGHAGPLAAAAAALIGSAPLTRVFETVVRRTSVRLSPPGGGRVELCIDSGEIRAGERSAPIHEAEVELLSGSARVLFDTARLLFPAGPVRFATLDKAARGFLLADRGTAEPPPLPLPDLAAATPVEQAARDVLRACIDQIAAGIEATLASTAPEGPHQVRVALRRLRTAFGLFRDSLGREALAPLAAAARDLGRVVGRLRDVDVLLARVGAAAALPGLDPAARDALAAALADRQEGERAAVQPALGSRAAATFLFDLAELVETRGWLVPSDWTQSLRLATPLGELAPALLDRCHRKVLKAGRRLATRTEAERHELRKEIKKLRYACEFLAPLWPGRRPEPFLRALRRLQDRFGEMNDAATARGLLTGPDAPAPADPAAQRGVGFLLGLLAGEAAAGESAMLDRWEAFKRADPFWR
jgi:inorganic triphosphatase YgiF